MEDTAPYTIPDIPYLRLRCTLRAEQEALLPSFKGSMLRGALGHALRRSACVMGPGQRCDSCGLRKVCLYTRLFETFIEDEPPPFLKGQTAAPRPFVLEVEEQKRHFAPGDRLRFDLLLFGSAVDLQALAGVAVARMAEQGLGERKRRFRAEEISALDASGSFRTLYSEERPVWKAWRRRWCRRRTTSRKARFVLHFKTPLRLKKDGHLLQEVAFRGLVFRMLTRVLELSHFFGNRSAIDWELRRFLRQTEGVCVTDQSLAWQDLKRYSARQGTEMTMGGLVGSLRLEGDLRPFAALLRAAEIVHIGKSTTFGLGQVEISA